jgi:hypothetical protein
MVAAAIANEMAAAQCNIKLKATLCKKRGLFYSVWWIFNRL